MTQDFTRLVLTGAVLAALAVGMAACSPAATGPGSDGSMPTTGTPSIVGTATGDPAQVSTETANGTSPSDAKSDVKAIDAELDAMQKELDSMSMPADSDFAPVEGALY